LLEISFDGSEESSLWVLLGLGGFGSGSFVSSDVFIRDGIGSNVRKSFKSESASIRNEKSDGKEGGGGFFGFFRPKPAAPVQPAVPEGRESQARWSDDDGSPMRNRRKSRSNSFSLSITRRNRDIASGRQAASSLDAPESASDAADVQALMATRGTAARYSA